MILGENLCSIPEHIRKRLKEIIIEIELLAPNYAEADNQHAISAFILKKFCDQDLTDNKKKFKKITFVYDKSASQLVNYKLELEKAISFTKKYQTFLTSDKDKYRLEKILAVIERSAAPLIKNFENQIYSQDSLTYNISNAYDHILEETREKIFVPKNEFDVRLLFSLFISGLMLRTEYYKLYFKKNNTNDNITLGDSILEDFFDFTYNIFRRKWIFAQFDKPVFFSTNIVSPWNWNKQKDGWYITPISNKISVYISKNNSYYKDYDFYENFSQYRDIYYSLVKNVVEASLKTTENYIDKHYSKLYVCTSYDIEDSLLSNLFSKQVRSIFKDKEDKLFQNRKDLIEDSRYKEIFNFSVFNKTYGCKCNNKNI